MVQSRSVQGWGQILDTMIGLTRLTNQQRVMTAGDNGMELYLELKRRGFLRVTSIAPSWIPRKSHTIGLIAGRESTATIESALSGISPFLCANATLAVLIDSKASCSSLQIRGKLQQMGFQIEAGVRCPQGLVLSAYRQGFSHMEKAA
ncbi:MAG: hypothetical protein ABSG88_09235 [Bradyrhizobium sp.]